MIVILMGAAGSGKTTVGRALATALGWPFHDADDLHSAASIAKMHRGVPLDDEDRASWLARVRAAVEGASRRGEDAVVACSALRDRYRRTIAADIPDVRWVFLRADAELLEKRLAARAGHFFNPAILPSQLAELEPQEEAIVVAADRPVESLVSEIRAAIGSG